MVPPAPLPFRPPRPAAPLAPPGPLSRALAELDLERVSPTVGGRGSEEDDLEVMEEVRRPIPTDAARLAGPPTPPPAPALPWAASFSFASCVACSMA